jgi:hypothetical protein
MKFRDLGAKPIILLAAVAQAVQYYAAFDKVTTGLPPTLRYIGGAAAGAAIVWSVSFVGNKIPTLNSKRAQRLAYGFGIGILLASPIALTLAHTTIMSIGWWVSVALIATLPELALAASAFVDRALFAESKPQKTQSAPAKTHKRKHADGYPRICPHCEYEAKTPAAWSTHVGRWCPVTHPRIELTK